MSKPAYPLSRLIEVEWEDSFTEGKWKSVHDYTAQKGMMVKSVGFVLKIDKKVVQLIQSVSEYDTIADSITIPRGCVRKIRRLVTA